MVVLFFAITIGIGLFFLLSTGSNVAMQNRKTLHQLQAYYIAQSGIQHTELALKLLPLDMFKSLKKNEVRDIIENINTENNQATIKIYASPSSQDRDSFDLFFESPPDDEFPYSAEYKLEAISLESSYKGMKGTQDGYKMKVTGTVFPYFERAKSPCSEVIEEDFIVSRFTGGIK